MTTANRIIRNFIYSNQNDMIEAVIKNLQRGVQLLHSIDDGKYTDRSIPPYFSSIGGHIRHILDIFDCILDGLPTKKINLIHRNRNEIIETQTQEALRYFKKIMDGLMRLEQEDLNQLIEVTDDLGSGEFTQKYTLGSALMQAHSHAIHHFAILGYIIYQLNISLPDEDFGYNPTTPRIDMLSS